jgi:hypothetical protein
MRVQAAHRRAGKDIKKAEKDIKKAEHHAELAEQDAADAIDWAPVRRRPGRLSRG